jgi:predicted RNA binding protein YcfA (HicA-like mRNA interferase family)
MATYFGCYPAIIKPLQNLYGTTSVRQMGSHFYYLKNNSIDIKLTI